MSNRPNAPQPRWRWLLHRGPLQVLLFVAVWCAWFFLRPSGDSGGPLVVYCAHDAIFSEKILRDFEKQTGVVVALRFDTEATKSLGLTELIIREKDAPRADVFWNNELLGMLDLQERGLLQPYQGPGCARIPAAFKAADGSWTGFAARLRVVIFNTARIGTTPPNLDLLPGTDHSRLAIAKPLYGTTLTHYTALWQLWGGDKLRAWHRDWRHTGGREANGNAAVKDLVAEGVCFAGYTDTDDFFAAKDAGQPVAMRPVWLENGKTICIPNTVAIVRGTKRQKAARQLVDYLLSAETELALANSKARQIPLGPVPPEALPEEVRELTEAAGKGVDLTVLGSARTECLAWLKSEYPEVSLAAPTALALLRALIIPGLAVAVAVWLSGWLAAQRGRPQILAWALLLAPFFTPPLLISYAFAKFALALVAAPLGHEALYLGVLTLKLAPVAVLVRLLVPPPLSAEAWHLYRTLMTTGGRRAVGAPAPAAGAPCPPSHPLLNFWRCALFRLRGEGRSLWLAAGLVFLLAFADFELASLWSIKTWTVAIFDAQIGGLALTDTLRLAATPLVVQLTVLALLTRAARGSHGPPGPALAHAPHAGRGPWIYLAAAALLLSVLPLTVIGTQALTGFRVLAEHFVLGPEIGASVLFALSATVAAAALARFARGRLRTLLLGTPALLGALVVSLLLLALFQIPPLRLAYDTPLPLVLALSVLLLPLALLLGALWTPPTPARHLAQQIGSRRLRWELETRPRAIALGLLFCGAYFDFTASSILAPVGFTPVFVRLHNLAHYGQTAVLSAMLLTACAAPMLGVLVAGAGARLLVGRR